MTFQDVEFLKKERKILITRFSNQLFIQDLDKVTSNRIKKVIKMEIGSFKEGINKLFLLFLSALL